jgi:uncharacterized protein YndB with AHSA1/START domain
MKKKSAAPAGGPKRTIALERTYEAAIEDVWDLWTTKQGIESWWGPDGFEVKVRRLDLRPGGELLYAMTAVAPPQVAFMKNAGLPLTTQARITYVEIIRHRRLAYLQLADFIPGVDAYDVRTTVDFEPAGSAVRMLLTFDAMHDEDWTQRALMGRESELERLTRALQA